MDGAFRKPLLSGYSLGPHPLRNRLVLSLGAVELAGGSGTDAQPDAKSIAEKAGAGLLIVEFDVPQCEDGFAGHQHRERSVFLRRLVDSVHLAGARVFFSLTRVEGLRCENETRRRRATGRLAPNPSRLGVAEIATLVERYANATRQAMTAGFDGVELNASNGCLPTLFLCSESNRREDRYGGSLCRRARFVLEVLEAMMHETDGQRVGIRVSPVLRGDDVRDCDPAATHIYLARAALGFGLAYLHVQSAETVAQNEVGNDAVALMRTHFRGTLIAGGYQCLEDAARVITEGKADLVGFRNPAIPGALRQDSPLSLLA